MRALLLSSNLEKIPMLFDLMVDVDVKVASLNNAEDEPFKSVFN